MRKSIYLLAVVACLFIFKNASSQLHEGKYKGAIYTEDKVPEYVLPDIMTRFDGKKVTTISDWENIRRPEILDFFARNMFGEIPTPPKPITETFEIASEDPDCLEGLCTKRKVMITYKSELGEVEMPLLLYVPNNAKGPVPAIFLYSGGDIRGGSIELDGPQRFGRTKNGIPLKQMMLRGIALITIDGSAFARGIRNNNGKLRGGLLDLFLEPGQKHTKDNECGMMALWAKAMQVGMDYIVTDKSIHPEQVAVLGCSVSGKVCLWAAANDQRIGMVLLATAGHGGDAIWRRQFGETLENMCVHLPSWICRNANIYAKDINSMPVDQHTLLATLAPRPLYVSNGRHDLWADQKGQWIGTYNASPSYKLYGEKVAFTSPEQPPVDSPIIESAIGYHVRSGFHGLTLYDWEKYMEFIEYHFLKIPVRSAHDVYYPDGKLVDHYPNMQIR
jgi:hypothetical protein